MERVTFMNTVCVDTGYVSTLGGHPGPPVRLPQRAPFYNASDWRTRSLFGAFFGYQGTLLSIFQPLIYNVLRRLTLLKLAILLKKRSASPESASRTCGPATRRQQDIRAFTADVPPSGSCSNTSNPAPLIRVAVSARSSAGSSMTDPHPTLITTAVGFITASSTSLIMCCVSSVNGAVATVEEAGWSVKENGELLALADASFDGLVTIDRNLRYQKNLAGHGIALLIMRVRTNRVVWMLQRAS